jgi:hypothetical protein
MSHGRRRVPMLVSMLLVAMLLPSAAFAQDAGFTTDPKTSEAQGPDGIVVTDVGVASLDGFDRVTFEIAGNGVAGWRIGYDDSPTTQGQGAPVEVEGDATLGVAITNALIPPDAPAGVEPFLDDVAGPEGGVVTEIVNNSIFEGDHQFFVGVTQALPFRVQHLQDPQRILIDIANDAPVGGVATGLGGSANGPSPAAVAAGLVALLLVALAGARALRPRRPV